MSSKKVALITGVSGQDGSYLAELLLAKNYQVVGTTHNPACEWKANIKHLKNKIELRHLNLSESAAIVQILKDVNPHEVYNFAAQSYVDFSWQIPEVTMAITAMAVLKFLEAIRTIQPTIKFYQASSSEIFAGNPQLPFDENSVMIPKTPYGCAKAFATQIVRAYRERYQLFAVSGILFNHESPRRGKEFLTQKIVGTLKAIQNGHAEQLRVGRLDIRRDWGYAPDYVEAIYAMMQAPVPEDYVIGTGQSHSVAELIQEACRQTNLDFAKVVVSDPQFFRPVDSLEIRANPLKAQQKLGWKPRHSFQQMVSQLLAAQS